LRLNGLVTDHSSQIHEATQRLVQTVDGLTDSHWAEPSLLPGWSRAHVIAHLTLNAEGLAAACTGVLRGETVPMYASPEARNDDIEELAGRKPAVVRERFLAATTAFAHALAALPDNRLDVSIERSPGTLTFPAGAVGGMRWREVMIHHVDLDAGFVRADWPTAFSEHVIDAMSRRVTATSPFGVRATDTGHAWSFGDGGPMVSGTAADLAWWLTGRGHGEGLTSDEGDLPGIEAW
jgi:maleylpyruvate isomerase